jgi:molybdopterin-binding protein
VQLDCGFLLVSYLTTQFLEHLELQAGKTVAAPFKATASNIV